MTNEDYAETQRFINRLIESNRSYVETYDMEEDPELHKDCKEGLIYINNILEKLALVLENSISN